MPPTLKVLDPTKNNATNLAAMRGKWKTAKDKHAEALKAKKITFSKDLGPMLDKRIGLYKTIMSFKTGDSIILARAQLNLLKANGKDILAAATSYQAKVHGMGNPAEEELTSVLRLIAKDAGQYDIDWVDNKFTSSAIAAEKKKAAEKAAKEKEKAKAKK